jgi:hypothetical protein
MKKIVIAGVFALILGLSGCYYVGPCIQGYGPVTTESRDLSSFTGVSNTGSFEVFVYQSETFGVDVEAQENLHPLIETYVSGGTLIIKTRNGNCIKESVPVRIYVYMPEIQEIRLTGSGLLEADKTFTDDFEISNSGSGTIRIDSVDALSAFIKNSGSGRVYLDGSFADEVRISQTGSGDILAGTIMANTYMSINHTSSGLVVASLPIAEVVDAKLTGSGKIVLDGDAITGDYSLSSSGKIDALDLVVLDADVSISGSGKVYVYATETMNVNITGSGDVLYRGDPSITSRITGSGKIRRYD